MMNAICVVLAFITLVVVIGWVAFLGVGIWELFLFVRKRRGSK